MKILMVCLGNICRSPMAEGILQHKLVEAGLPWQVDSAGTGNWHVGQPPHHLSQQTCANFGIEIANQRCRQLTRQDFDTFDRILFMDEQNLIDGKRLAGSKWDGRRFRLFLSYLPEQKVREVPDPYFGTEKDYVYAFELLSKAADAFIKQEKKD